MRNYRLLTASNDVLTTKASIFWKKTLKVGMKLVSKLHVDKSCRFFSVKEVQRKRFSVENGKDERQLPSKMSRIVAAHLLSMSCSYEQYHKLIRRIDSSLHCCTTGCRIRFKVLCSIYQILREHVVRSIYRSLVDIFSQLYK